MTTENWHSLDEVFAHAYQIKVQVLEGGKMPSKAHANDAGFDLYATSDFSVAPGEIIKHPLNIKMELPINSYMEITTKSGLGSKGILVYAGIVDSPYRGIPHVILTNLGRNVVDFTKGQKIAQGIMHQFDVRFFMTQVDEVLSNTDRGNNGFGSSGDF